VSFDGEVDWLLRLLGVDCVWSDDAPELLDPPIDPELLCPVVERDGDCICELCGAAELPLSFELEDGELDCANASALVPASSTAASAALFMFLNDIRLS
jgi:hypothetical protein